jgi:hypothetical protein
MKDWQLALDKNLRLRRDDIQWILERRGPNGPWKAISYCRTRNGLVGSLVFHDVSTPAALNAVAELPEHIEDAA